MDAHQVLDREFHEVRAKLLEVAASLDRIARAEGTVAADPRLAGVRQALDVLGSSDDDRAEQIQLIFSLPYDDAWQDKYFPAES